MRSFIPQVLVIVSIVLIGFSLQCGIQVVSASTDKLTRPESRYCPHCRALQLIESDLPTWQCDTCKNVFWFSSGKSPVPVR